MPRVVTVLAEGFEEVEAVTVIDLLRRAGIEVTVLGLGGVEVRGAHGIWVRADAPLDGFGGEFDAIALPGGGPGTNNLAASGAVLEMVRAAYASGKICAAICAAPAVLAKAGILGGKRAACYPGCEGRLPADAVVAQEGVVTDGNIITSRAAGTAIPFALELIRALSGEGAARKIGADILFQG